MPVESYVVRNAPIVTGRGYDIRQQLLGTSEHSPLPSRVPKLLRCCCFDCGAVVACARLSSSAIWADSSSPPVTPWSTIPFHSFPASLYYVRAWPNLIAQIKVTCTTELLFAKVGRRRMRKERGESNCGCGKNGENSTRPKVQHESRNPGSDPAWVDS